MATDSGSKWAELQATWARQAAFDQQLKTWFAARCAKHGLPDDAGERVQAQDWVRGWLLVNRWPDGDAGGLNGADLCHSAWCVDPASTLDPDRLITAMLETIGWLCACGLFDALTTTRLLYEVEAQREFYVDWWRPRQPASESPEGKAIVAEFLVWLYEVKQRPEDPLMADDAVMIAALDTLGHVDGDLSTLDVAEWLDWAAMLAFDEPLSLGLRSLMRDVIEWFGTRGRLTALGRARLRRELDRVRRVIRLSEILPKSTTPPIEA